MKRMRLSFTILSAMAWCTAAQYRYTASVQSSSTGSPLTDAEASSVSDTEWNAPMRSKDEAKAAAATLRLAFKSSGKVPPQGIQAQSATGRVAVGTATTTDQGPNKVLEKWWANWKRQNKKAYSTPAAEKAAKDAFLDNIAKTILLNEDDKAPFWAGLNEYSDLTGDQMDVRMIPKLSPMRGPVKTMSPLDEPITAQRYRNKLARLNISTPTNTRKLLQDGWIPAPSDDWRKYAPNVLVRNQGACASAWAFAVATSLEVAYSFNENFRYTPLSAQQLLDCEQPKFNKEVYSSQGCAGGYVDTALDYVRKINLTTEARYPYKGVTSSTCSATGSRIPSGTAVKLRWSYNDGVVLEPSTIYLTRFDPVILINAVWVSPLIVFVHASDAFKAYKGGIFNPTSSQCSASLATHAVVVMGYSYSGPTGDNYFTLLNSWGTSWGENGYMRIAMWGGGPGPCGMYQYPLFPSSDYSKYLKL